MLHSHAGAESEHCHRLLEDDLAGKGPRHLHGCKCGGKWEGQLLEIKKLQTGKLRNYGKSRDILIGEMRAILARHREEEEVW